MKSERFRIFILALILLSRWLSAQPVGEPEVRWLAGGNIIGPNLVAFSADGTAVFTHAAADFGLKKWDFTTRRLLSLTPVPEKFTMTAGLSNDQRKVAMISSYGLLHLCRVDDGSVIWSVRLGTVADTLSFSSDDRLLLTQELFGVIRVWRTADGEPIEATFTDGSGNSTNAFRWAEFFNATEFLALADGEVIRFNAETGDAAWRTVDPALGGAWVAAVAPDGTEFCVAATNGLRRYAVADGQLIADLYTPPTDVTRLAYSPDGATLAVALHSGGIELRDVADGSLKGTLSGIPAGEATINAIAWSPDGQRLVAGGTYGSYWWSLTGDTNAQPLIPLVRALRTPARFSHDGQWVVKGSWPHDVVLLNATNGLVAHRWTLEPEADVERACPSPTTNVVFIPIRTGHLEIRTLPEGTLLNRVCLLTDVASWFDLEVSADGSRLLAFEEWPSERFTVFSTETWQALRSVTHRGIMRARISPDGTRVVSSDCWNTFVWMVDGDSRPVVIPGGGSLEFGAEPDQVWTLNREGWIDLWRMTDGSHLGGVKIPLTNYTAVLSPNRRLLLTSQSGRQPMKIWRTDNGACIAQIAGPAAIQLIQFTAAADHRWLVATRRDGSLLAFDFPFFIQDPVVAGGQLHLRLVGAPGPFQIESRSLTDTGWSVVSEPFDEQIWVPLAGDVGRLYRARR